MITTIENGNAIHFSFGAHNRGEKKDVILQQASSFFGESPIKNIFFKEDASIPRSIVLETLRLQRQGYSYFDAFFMTIAQQNRQSISLSELAALRARFAQQQIASGVAGFAAAEVLLLDQLSTQYRVEIHSEYYKDQDVERMKRLAQRFMAPATQVVTELQGGRINRAMRIVEDKVREDTHYMLRRNRNIATLVMGVVREIQSPYRIFIRMGSYHDYLVPLLETGLATTPDRPNLSVRYDDDSSWKSFTGQLMFELEQNPSRQISEEELGRTIFDGLVKAQFQLRGTGQLEAARKAKSDILDRTSSDEITELLQSLRGRNTREIAELVWNLMQTKSALLGPTL